MPWREAALTTVSSDERAARREWHPSEGSFGRIWNPSVFVVFSVMIRRKQTRPRLGHPHDPTESIIKNCRHPTRAALQSRAGRSGTVVTCTFPQGNADNG